MATPVWGTFSVRDHCQPEAFLREALLFDRLVVPYPDPTVDGEWERWKQPNPRDPSESWDPQRLDDLLAILGTKKRPGHNGAQLAVCVDWNESLWQGIRGRLDVAGELTGDPYMATRLGLRQQGLPRLVQAVAAFPSEAAWRQEVTPTATPSVDISAAEALVQLPRPLLLPEASRDNELDNLRRVVDLSGDPEFARMRAAYFDWFRGLVQPLQRAGDNASLEELRLDPASIQEANDQLRALWDQERQVLRRADRAKMWTRIEYGVITVGTAASVGLACAAALPVVGVPAVILPFIGWAISKWNKPPDQRGLGGASMFVEARRRLGWPELAN